MCSGLLVLLGLVCGTALGGLLQEDLPPEQLDEFLAEVIFHTKGSMAERELPDVNVQLIKINVGFPLELMFATRNATLLGPSSLENYGNLEGHQGHLGSATVTTSLALGDFEVRYPYFLVDLFGYKLEGTAQMLFLKAIVDLRIEIYRNVLTRCQVITTLSKPKGTLLITFGEDGTWLRLFSSVVEYAMRTLTPTWLIEWGFSLDVEAQLNQAIKNAAKSTACS